MPIAIRFASVCRRLLRPRSSGTDLPPRTAGTSPALHDSRRICPADIGVPVSRVPAPRPVLSLSSSMVIATIAAIPPAWGSLSTGRCSTSSANACPNNTGYGHLATLRVQPGAGVVPAGGGERLDRLAQHVGLGGGQLEPTAGGAVAVVAHREPGLLPGPALLPFQRLALAFVGLVGGEDLEQPPREHPQPLRVINGRELDQVLLRGEALFVGDLAGGEVLDRPDDHPGLVDRQRTGRERRPGRREPRPGPAPGRRAGRRWSGTGSPGSAAPATPRSRWSRPSTPISLTSAAASTRHRSSVTRAASRVSSTSVSACSSGVIAHPGASARLSSTARARPANPCTGSTRSATGVDTISMTPTLGKVDASFEHQFETCGQPGVPRPVDRTWPDTSR